MRDITRCALVLGITAVTAVAEKFGSAVTGSNGLLADALHLFGDGIPFLLSFCILADFLPHEEESAEIVEDIIVFCNAVFLAAAALYLSGRGIYRLLYPAEIEQSVLWFALFGLAGNAAQLYFAHGLKHAHHHAGVHRSQMLHLASDLAASIAVVLAAWIVTTTGYSKADSIASLLVAAITWWAAWQCGKHLLPGAFHAHGHTGHKH